MVQPLPLDKIIHMLHLLWEEGKIIKLPGERNDYPLWYSCLENFMDRGAWWAAVHEITKELDMTEQLIFSLSKKWRIWFNILFYDRKHLVIPKVVMLIFYDPKDCNVLLSDIVSHLSQFGGHFYCTTRYSWQMFFLGCGGSNN